MSYRVDPDDNTKMSPKPLPSSVYGSILNPANCTAVSETPDYIIVNTELDAPVGFFFGTSASLSTAGNTTQANYTTMLNDGALAGTKLEIHPTAYSSSAADAGQITFVYKGGF